MKDHKNLGEKVFAAFFLLFVLGFSGANLAVNGAEVWDDVSKIQWTWNDSAQQLQEVETFMNENLLFRYPMIDAYGAVQMAMGKHEENGFDRVKDKNGFLYSGNFWNGFGDDTKELAVRTARLQKQIEARGDQFGFIMFPMNLPQEDAKYYGIPYDDFSQNADTFCAWARYYGVPLLDLRSSWTEHGLTQEEAFFRTDHHWTPMAAFYGYCDILEWMEDTFGAEISDRDRLSNLDSYYQITYENLMFGSRGRDTGTIFAGGAEPYTVIYPREEGDYLLKSGEYNDYDTYEGTFSEALLYTDYDMDSYSDLYDGEAERTYLKTGVEDYTSIINKDAPSDKKILLLRDSFATPIGAFLAQSFEQVDMLWTGEYTEEELELFIEDAQYDYVFVSIFAENLNQDFFPFGMDHED